MLRLSNNFHSKLAGAARNSEISTLFELQTQTCTFSFIRTRMKIVSLCVFINSISFSKSNIDKNSRVLLTHLIKSTVVSIKNMFYGRIKRKLILFSAST